MKIPALRYLSEPENMDFHVAHLEWETAQDLERFRETNTPVMYLIAKTDLPAIRELGAFIIDRGVKNEHKGLSGYLLNFPKNKIPVVDGNYKASRQLARSIRTTMLKAEKSGDSPMFIIGIEEKIFRELWLRAEAREKSRDKKGAKASIPGVGAGETPTRFLLQLMGRRREPQSLVERYVGRSIEVQLVRHLILFAAKTDDPVLILGPTGTGKELVAREIHRNGPRNEREFIPVNCGAIPNDLFESELFGFERGSFTSAVVNKRGLWEAAGDGTLFLDEIGDLLPHHQAKILRALEEGKIRRVGGLKDIDVKARVIAATNRDLFSMVHSGEYREDLYYRLRGFTIRTPSLKDHEGDIPLLAQSLWKKITQSSEATLPQDILDELASRRWPGNAREIKMVLSNLRALFGTEDLDIDHLRAIFYLEGQDVVCDEPKPDNAVALHRAECLQHLKRADEVVHVMRRILLPVVEQHKTDRLTISLVHKDLYFPLNEIEMLARKHLLFYSESCFSSVYNLKEKVSNLQNLLRKHNVKQVLKLWEEEIEDLFNVVMSNLFKEVERVLDKA